MQAGCCVVNLQARAASAFQASSTKADLDCMRQYESVQQLMQALLQAGQMPEFQVCYAHKGFTEIPEQQLADGGVERRYPTPHSLCQLWGS